MPLDFERLVLEESPDAIIVATVKGEIVYWNKGAVDVFGYTETEAVGHFLNDLVIPSDRSHEEHNIFQETIETGFSNYESFRQKKDGSLIYVDVSNKAIRNSQGEVEFVPSGYNLILARNVSEAFVILDHTIPDLILSDLRMRFITGYDFLRAVKQNPTLREIPFLVITSSFHGERDRELCIGLGAKRFIVQPIDPKGLLEEVEECLQ